MADGALRDSVRAAGSTLAQRVDYAGHGVATTPYDLVVASATDVRTLCRAREGLREGGILYAESSANVGVRRLVRRLTRSGYTDVVVVRAWPSFRDVQAWLPLCPNDAGSTYFLTDHPIAARHPVRRLVHAIRRLASLSSMRAGWGASLAVVALRTSNAAEVRPNRPWWLTTDDDTTAPEDKWLLLTPSPDPDAHVVGLAWRGGQHLPDVAVKFGRTASSARRLGDAADTLEHLHRKGFSQRGYAPALIRRIRSAEGDVVAIAEEALRGQWLNTAVRKHNLHQLTEEITDWQVQLAQFTRSNEPTDLWASRFGPSVARFREVSRGLVDDQLLERVEDLLRSMGPSPTVVEHHDFRPWNVYRRSNGSMAAFDWDGARRHGIPAFDLIQAHAYLGFALDGSMRSWRFRAAHELSERGALGDVRRACRARYACAVGMSDEAMRAARAFAWIELCTDEAERRAASGSPLRRDELDRSLFSMWDYEARQACDTDS
jgi:hypothetical protein